MKFEKPYYPGVWAKLFDAEEEGVKATPSDEWRWGFSDEAILRALGPYKLICFCERFRAANPCPWNDIPGYLPARIYLMNKHHWSFHVVSEMTTEELMLALHLELTALRLNPEESEPIRQWANGRQCRDLLDLHLEQP